MTETTHYSTPVITLERRHGADATVFQNDDLSQDDLALINRLAPTRLRADQVYARSMYLCSNQLCETDGCRFTRQALGQIATRIVGQSVLYGHNRATLPLARFFRAEVVERGRDGDSRPLYFVRAWFYWLREVGGAKDLLLNIDGGVYREVSLAWKYQHWRCSICGVENGRCEHRPGRRYDERLCHRVIDEIGDVLEGSLVYKGADRDALLSGMRDAREPEGEPIVLVCYNDDPLLKFLTAQELIEEIADPLDQNAALIWARCDVTESLPPLGGALLLDAPSESEDRNRFRVFERKPEGLREMILEEAQGDET